MEAFKQCCGNVPHYIVSIIVIILTLLFYGLQIALVFLLFPVTPNGMIVAYASPGKENSLKFSVLLSIIRFRRYNTWSFSWYLENSCSFCKLWCCNS